MRVHWVRTVQLTVWRESHAPSTAVQWIPEELPRTVTAIRDSRDSSSNTAQAWDLFSTQTDLLWNISRLFISTSSAPMETSQALVYLSATEDDSSETCHICSCGSTCWWRSWGFAFRYLLMLFLDPQNGYLSPTFCLCHVNHPEVRADAASSLVKWLLELFCFVCFL